MLSFPTALAGAAVTAGVVAATYWYFSRKAAATLLTVIDDSGNSFAPLCKASKQTKKATT